MNLRAVLVVAFGPALTACQVQVATDEGLQVEQGTGSAFSSQDDWAPGFAGSSTRSSCVKMPAIPQIWTAERVFFSFFNTVKFMDRNGKEFGYVQSWASDWKNIFGYAGASFYLKTTESQGSDGIWRIDGPTTGEDGTFADSPLTQEGLADNEQQMFGDTNLGQGSQVRQEQGRGWWDLLFRGTTDQHHRLAAFMVGSHEGPVGNPFKDDMTIRDCNGQAQVKVTDGKLVFRNAKDARVIQQQRNTQNTLILRDSGEPPMDLVRVTAKESCKPFPPFCAQMGQWNWFIHANEWEGHIVTPGSTNDMGSSIKNVIPDLTLTVSMSSGESEDIRFLTLYSAYQFANTRWSPFMNWVWWLLVVIPLFCCLFRCFCGSREEKPTTNIEETEKLMQTQEAQEKLPEKREGGFLACCSRRGGRGVAAN